MLNKSKALLSMPIISLEEGRQIGRVRGVVVNPETFYIAALVTDKQSWFGDYKVIPFENVMSIGENAVTIDNQKNIEKPANIPEISKLLKKKIPLLGGKVYSETGTLLGIVEEFSFDTETGKLESLEVSGRFIENLFRGRTSVPISKVVTIGTDAIIISKIENENLDKIDSPFQRKIKAAKSSGNKLFKDTKSTTKNFSRSLGSSIEKFAGSDSTDKNTESKNETNQNPGEDAEDRNNNPS